MSAPTTTNRNLSAAAPARRSKEEYYNVGPEENADTANLEGIPEEANGSAAKVGEKRGETEEAALATEEEAREKELEKGNS